MRHTSRGWISPGCLPEPCTEEIEQSGKDVCTKKCRHSNTLVIFESTGLVVISTPTIGDKTPVYSLLNTDNIKNRNAVRR